MKLIQMTMSRVAYFKIWCKQGQTGITKKRNPKGGVTLEEEEKGTTMEEEKEPKTLLQSTFEKEKVQKAQIKNVAN